MKRITLKSFLACLAFLCLISACAMIVMNFSPWCWWAFGLGIMCFVAGMILDWRQMQARKNALIQGIGLIAECKKRSIEVCLKPAKPDSTEMQEAKKKLASAKRRLREVSRKLHSLPRPTLPDPFDSDIKAFEKDALALYHDGQAVENDFRVATAQAVSDLARSSH